MNSLENKRVLVTGGCGFIGSHIVERLLELKAEIVVLDDLSTGKLVNIQHCLDKIEFIEGDIRDEVLLEKILNNVEYISHQAALRSVPKSVDMPFDYHEVNATGTLKLYLKAKEKGVRRIVYASSSSVYGDTLIFPEKETALPQPLSPYAASKLFGEHYGCIFSRLYGIEAVSLRYFNVFGPRQSLENKYAVVIPKFITSLLGDESPPIYGDGSQERDFTYIDNIVEANILALTKEGLAGEVFNIASGTPKSVNHLLEILKDITNKKHIAPVYLPPRAGDVRKTWADITKAKKLLGWEVKVDFYEGLVKTVEWFKNVGLEIYKA